MVLQLQAMVQLPEGKTKTGKGEVHHRANLRGGQQLPWESIGVYAQGNANSLTHYQTLWWFVLFLSVLLSGVEWCISDPFFALFKMPRIWLDYCQFLVSQSKITRCRRSFDRALRALPVTQHPRIWPLYLRFARNLPLPETAIRVYRRYLKVSPSDWLNNRHMSVYQHHIHLF